MDGKTCCVTGHRDIPAEQLDYVKDALRREIKKAISDGFTCFLSGFADGVDQYFAEIVVDLQKVNPALQLTAVLPYQKRLDSLRAREQTRVLLDTQHYKEDFDLDKELIQKMAVSENQEDRHLLWMSRPVEPTAFGNGRYI